jgi:hypothetical protein
MKKFKIKVDKEIEGRFGLKNDDQEEKILFYLSKVHQKVLY